MAKGNQRFEAKLYGVDTEAKSGRKKIGETAVLEAPNALDAAEQVIALAREGIPADALAGLHSVTVRMETPKATTGNPFGSAS